MNEVHLVSLKVHRFIGFHTTLFWKDIIRTAKIRKGGVRCCAKVLINCGDESFKQPCLFIEIGASGCSAL